MPCRYESAFDRQVRKKALHTDIHKGRKRQPHTTGIPSGQCAIGFLLSLLAATSLYTECY